MREGRSGGGFCPKIVVLSGRITSRAEKAAECSQLRSSLGAVAAMFLFCTSLFAAKLTVDQDGGSAYTTVVAATQAAASGDTIYFQGTDIDIYTESWDGNLTAKDLTFLGSVTNPDSFPVLTISGWTTNLANHARNIRFNRVVLNNCSTLPAGANNGGRKIYVDNCIIRSYSNNVFSLNGDHDGNTYLFINNTVFLNNTGTIFPNPSTYNNSGPYGYVYNSTFYGNSTVSAQNPNATNVSDSKLVYIHNSIFRNNTTISANTAIKAAWTYNLIPTTETATDWGTGYYQSDSPGFVNGTPTLPSHFNLISSADAKGRATSSGAPSTDIAGRTRSAPFDMGAWEYIPEFYILTWDPDAAAGIQSGGGTWGTDNFWTEDNGVTRIAWPGENSSAVFSGSGGSDYTVNVNGTQNVDSLCFLSSKYFFEGGTIDLGSKNGIFVADWKSAVINSVVSGTNGIVKYGSGEVQLGGNNTFTGPSTIIGGKIKLLHSNALGATSGATTVQNGAAVVVYGSTTYSAEHIYINGTGINYPGALRASVDGVNENSVWPGTVTLQSNSTIGAPEAGDQLTVSGVVEGGYQLTTDGSGTITLSGSNTFSGGVVVNNGILKAGNSSALGSYANTITINSGASLDINGFDLRGYTNNISIAGTGINASTGVLFNSGADQINALRQISLAGDATIGSDGGRFDIGRGYSGGVRITGNNYTLTKTGSNLVGILAEATGLSGVVINGGELRFEDNDAVGAAPITINSGATLSTWGGRTLANSITLNGGTITSPSSSADTFSGSVSLSGTNTFDPQYADITVSGIMSGTGNLNKIGSNRLVVSGANTYSGGTTVSGGILVANSNTALGTGSVTLDSGAKRLMLGSGVQLNNDIVINNGVDPGAGYGALNVENGGTLAGTITINSPTTSGGHFQGGNLGNLLTISGQINSSVEVVARTGNIRLSGGGSYNLLTLGNGTVSLGALDGVSTSAALSLRQDWGATVFDLNGYNQIVTGISQIGAGDASVTNTSGTAATLTINAASDYNFYGTIDGNLVVTKQGAGIQTLSGPNTYSGNTTISAGTLNVTGSLSSSSAVAVQPGATLTGTGNAAGSVTVSSSGIIAPGNSGAGTFSTGALTLNSGSVLDFELGTSRDSVKVNGDLALDATLNVSALDGFGSGDYTLISYSGTYSGSGITLGTMPAGYDYSLTYNGGNVILTVSTPQVITFSPADDATDVAPNTALTVTFDRDVVKGSGNVYIKRTSDNSTFEQFSVSDSRVAVDSVINDFETGNEDFTSGTPSTWTTQNAFSGAGVIYALLDNETYPWTGKGVSGQDWSSYDSLIIWAFTPSSGISASAYIMDGTWSWTTQTPVVNLNQNTWTRVSFDLQGCGINLNDVWQYGLQVMTANTPVFIDRVSLKRNSGSPVVSIIPSNHFSANTGYYVQIDDGAFGSMNDADFGGINSITDWNFITGSRHFFWDNNTGAGYQVSNGTWGSDSFWSTDGLFLFSWPGSGHTATFAGANGSYTVNVNSIQGVDSIAFLNTGYTLSGGALVLNGENSINAAVDATINSVVDGTELKKYGSGTLTLGGANTYTGQTDISSGALLALHADALGTTGQGTVVNSGASLELQNGITYAAEPLILNGTGLSGNGALRNVNGTNTWTGTINLNSASSIHSDLHDLIVTGVVSGSGSLTKTGTGRLKFTAANTYSGLTTIFGRDIILVSTGGLGSTSSGTVVNSGAALTLAGRTDELPNGTVYAAEPLTLNGAGYSTDGALRLGSGDITAAIWSGPITLGSAASIGVSEAGDTLTVSSAVSGDYALTVYGLGRLLLTNDNTYSGPTTVSSGILQIGNGASGSVSGDIVNDASLVFHRTGSLSYGGNISGTGSVTKSNTGTVTLTGANTYTGTTRVTGGTLVLNGSLSSSSALTISSGAVLAGTGTAAGAVTVNGGATVAPGDNGAGTLSTGPFSLNSTSALDIELGTSSDQIAVSGNLILDGTVNISDLTGFGPGDYTIITYTGSLTNNTLEIGTKPAGYDISVSTATSGSVILSVAAELARYTWDVSTDAGVQVNDGTWGTDAFWTLSSGTGVNLVNWPGAGCRAVFAANEGRVGGGGYSDGHGDGVLTGWTNAGSRNWSESGGGVTASNGTSDIGFLVNDYDCAANGTYSFVLKGPGNSNSHFGGAVFRFTDASNYYFLALNENWIGGASPDNQLRLFVNTTDWASGGTLIKDNLDLSGKSSTYNIEIKLEGSIFTFWFEGDSLGQITDATHVSGKVGYAYHTAWDCYIDFDSSAWVDAPTPGSAGPYSITVNGTQSVDSVLFTASGFTLSGGTINLTGATPAISTDAKATIGSVVSGSNGLRKAGADTLILTGDCIYTGGTSIDNGTLQLGNGSTSGSVSGSINNNGMLVVNRSDQLTLGTVTGAGAVVKKGGGTLVLAENNTYTGGTVIENGAVQIGDGGTSGSLKGDINNNSVLKFNRSDTYSYQWTAFGNGAVEQNGNGTLVLSGANSYTGNTTVASGTLQIDGSLGSTAVTVAGGAALSGTGSIDGSVSVQADGVITPGGSGTGKLTTGGLSLNSTSVLDFDFGATSDTVAITGNLVLDGVLDITDLDGFKEGSYTIITYSGSLTDNTLEIRTAPLGYEYSIAASGGEIKLNIVNSHELLPLTVKTTASQCSVYTDKWTLVFDNAWGGGISVLTDSCNGISSGTTGNQAPTDRTLYYFDISGVKSSSTGSWSLIDTSLFHTTVRQSGTIHNLSYIVDYTVHGSGKMFVKTSFSNKTGSPITSQYKHGVARNNNTNTVFYGNDTASLNPYALISASDVDHFDPLMVIKDLWNKDSGAVNSAAWLLNDGSNVFAGYAKNDLELDPNQKQIWEFMIDFSHKSWSDTSGIGQYTQDYRQTDSLTFLAGTRALEKSWENHLQGHWALDEGTGSAVHDQSGNGRNGTLSNGTWSTGKFGNGLTLGSSSTVLLGDVANFDGRFVFTVMAWIKPSAVLSSSSHIFGKHDGSKGYRLTGDNGKLSLVLDNNILTGSRTLETGKWYHVAATFSRESGKVYLYIDGRIDRIFEGMYLADYNSASAVIGGGFEGDIDDVRFYSEAVSENTLKAVYQRGYRSSEGFYQVRADNNSALHVEIDGSEITRRHPVFEIANYWGGSVPPAGAVMLDGTVLVEGTDYYAKLVENRLFLALNKMISWDNARLYVHKSSSEGAFAVGPTKKIEWGRDNLEGTDYFWVKNFEGNRFGDAQANQFYLNWKMSNASQSKGGELTFMSTSVSSPNVAIDTIYNTNMIPDYSSSNDSWGQMCLNINGNWPKTTQHVTNTVSYEVAESSAVRLVLNMNERIVSNTESFRVKTRWTIYPTGQIFRYDSLYNFSAAPTGAYVGAFFSKSSGATMYQNNKEKRAGVVYSGSYPDYAYAWLGMRNASGFQSAPFDSDTIMPVSGSYRTGFDFGDNSCSGVWNSTSIETALYMDIQQSSMDQAFMDSACNSVQYIGTGGNALDIQDGSLVTASQGDLNGDGFNECEGAYVVSASSNTVHFKIPASGDTARYYPAFRITNYTAAKKPQYVFVYRGSAAGDTLALLEGYQYNMYHNVARKELVFQIDSVFNDTVGIYLSSDVTLAVTLSSFQALPGDGCDTLRWRTESESENLGFYIHRRIKPAFMDSLANVNDTSGADDGLNLLKESRVSFSDTSWKRTNEKIIPGAESGVSHGPKNYLYIDKGVYNDLLYEYMLVAVDFSNSSDTVAYAEAMPFSRLPLEFRLGGNYPNPFRNLTVIRFELPVGTKLRLDVYDIRGRLVKRIVRPDKVYKAGSHKVYWDCRDERGAPVAAGNYFYRIETRSFVKTKRMVKF